jgi:hypothetical protein
MKESYTEIMGKWSHKACKFADDWVFWFVCLVYNALSEKLDPLLWTIEKYGARKEQTSEDKDGWSNLAMLVYGKAHKLFEAMQALITDDPWKEALEFAWRHMPGDDVGLNLAAEIPNLLRKVSTRFIGRYRRRILEVIESSQCQVLWIAHVPHDQPSEKRVEVLKRIVHAVESTLHISCRKLKKLFQMDMLNCISREGRIDLPLWTLCRVLASDWSADSQELEGVMSLIRIAEKLGSNKLSQSLLDSRVSNIKSMGLGTRATKGWKFSRIAPALQDVVNEGTANFQHHHEVMDDVTKWRPARPITHAISPASIEDMPIAREALAWSSSYGLLIHRACLEQVRLGSGDVAMVFKTNDLFSSAWVASGRYKYQTWVSEVRFRGEDGVDLLQPVHPLPIAQVLATLYTDCCTRGAKISLTFAPVSIPLGGVGSVMPLEDYESPSIAITDAMPFKQVKKKRQRHPRRAGGH